MRRRQWRGRRSAIPPSPFPPPLSPLFSRQEPPCDEPASSPPSPSACPCSRRATYNATSRAETRALLAESGQADLVFTLDPSDAARRADVEGVEVQSVAIPRVTTLKLNAGQPFLEDAKARRAIGMAIDRAGIAAGILRTPEVAANQVFAPILSAWHDPSVPPATCDVEGAKALLAELGWRADDDGILTRDGKPFRLGCAPSPTGPNCRSWRPPSRRSCVRSASRSTCPSATRRQCPQVDGGAVSRSIPPAAKATSRSRKSSVAAGPCEASRSVRPERAMPATSTWMARL